MSLARVCLLLLSLVALPIGCTAEAASADFPLRPVTLVVPFAAGGPTDSVARTIADRMERPLGQPLVVENVVGAAGTTGVMRVKRSLADGHTLVMGHLGTHAAAVSLYPKLPYEPIADFAPIGLVAGTPVVILARKDMPATNLAEFVEHLKSTRLRMAHAGIGSVSYTFCQMLNRTVGVRAELVSFNGTGPAMDALVTGRVDYMCDQIVNAVRPLEAQAIRAYAIGTPERSPALPDVPTTAEAGMPRFRGSAWNALFAPKGTPKAVIEKLNAALVEALDDEATRKQLAELGCVIPAKGERTPEALTRLVRAEIERWAEVFAPETAAASGKP